MHKYALIALFTTLIASAQSRPPTLDLRISSTTVPTGGTAQITIYLGTPQPISEGTIVLAFSGPNGYLDKPQPIQGATVFSATGDVSAVGNIDSGGTFTLQFTSPSAGVGRLPGVPIMEFSILAGSGCSITLFQGSGFSGPGGIYPMTAQAGSVAIGGALSIQSVTPTGSSGIIPAGSILTITGTGFQSATALNIDGVSVASVNIASSSLIIATLAAATEITGKRLVLTNADGSQITYWGGLGASLYTLPLSPASPAICARPGPAYEDPISLVVRNPNPAAAQVAISNAFGAPPGQSRTVTVPSGGDYFTAISDPPNSTIQSDPSTPVRVLCFVSYQESFDPLGIFTVVSQAGQIPSVGSVVNAASALQAAVSPGEIVAIYGVNMGPVTPMGVTLDAFGNIGRNLSGVQVLFDGIPAPLLYASASQVNAVVPYEIFPDAVTVLQVEYNGAVSAPWGLQVAASAPAIFTLASNGQGGAAVLNQDNSVNTAANPAPAASVLQIFATGEGLTSPAATTGAVVANGSLRSPLLPVHVTIGSENALVLYAGSAPGEVAGLFQVNVQLPKDLAPDSSVPVVLVVGSGVSQATATVAIK